MYLVNFQAPHASWRVRLVWRVKDPTLRATSVSKNSNSKYQQNHVLDIFSCVYLVISCYVNSEDCNKLNTVLTPPQLKLEYCLFTSINMYNIDKRRLQKLKFRVILLLWSLYDRFLVLGFATNNLHLMFLTFNKFLWSFVTFWSPPIILFRKFGEISENYCLFKIYHPQVWNIILTQIVDTNIFFIKEWKVFSGNWWYDCWNKIKGGEIWKN